MDKNDKADKTDKGLRTLAYKLCAFAVKIRVAIIYPVQN